QGREAEPEIGLRFLRPRQLQRLQHQAALLRLGDAAAILAVASVEQQDGIVAAPAQHVDEVMRSALICGKARALLQVLRDVESWNHRSCRASAQPLRSAEIMSSATD